MWNRKGLCGVWPPHWSSGALLYLPHSANNCGNASKQGRDSDPGICHLGTQRWWRLCCRIGRTGRKSATDQWQRYKTGSLEAQIFSSPDISLPSQQSSAAHKPRDSNALRLSNSIHCTGLTVQPNTLWLLSPTAAVRRYSNRRSLFVGVDSQPQSRRPASALFLKNLLRLSSPPSLTTPTTITSLMTDYRVSSFCMFMQNPRERTEQLNEIWGTFNTPSPHGSTSSAPTTDRDSSSSILGTSTTLESESHPSSISDRVSKAWRSIRVRTRSFAPSPKTF